MKITTPGQPWFIDSEITCAVCGCTFVLEGSTDPMVIGDRAVTVRCPTCTYQFNHLHHPLSGNPPDHYIYHR